RLDVQPTALLQAVHSGQRTPARQVENRGVQADARPLQAELVAGDVTLDIEPPVRGIRGKLQAAGIDRDLGGPAGRGTLHLRIPGAVPIVVRIARSRRDQAVAARPAGIDLEYVAEAVRTKGVQHDGDVVVVGLIAV